MTSSELATYIKADLFFPNIEAKDREGVLDAMIEPLIAGNKVTSKELLLTTLKQRETMGSTGIGKNVAIPHCRTMSLSEIYLVVGISKDGIDYNSPDGKKVHLFFLILAPPQEETNNYLPILGKICEMAKDDKLRKKMISTRDYETFVQLIREGR